MEEKICKNCGKVIAKEWRKDKVNIRNSPLRFCSIECSRSYTIEHRKKGTVSRKVCPNCNEEIGATAFNRHYKACIEGRIQRYSGQPKDKKGKTQAWYDSMKNKKPAVKTKINFTCQYCKVCFENKNKEQKGIHELHCRMNPNRKPYPREGKPVSEEQRKKLSETQKRNLKEGKVFGYKLNHSSKVSFPEQYFMEVLKDLPVKYNFQVGLYQLDFAIPEKKVYIEVDGEQHYTDKRIVAHDKERTEVLNNLGWKCLERIRWSIYQKLDEDSKKEYCNKLIGLLNAQIQ